MSLEEPSNRPFLAMIASATVVVLALVGVAILIWYLGDVLLLVFAAVVVAIILRSLADFIVHYVPRLERVALVLACLIIAGLVGGFIALLGAQFRGDFQTLIERLPQQLAAFGEDIGIGGLTDELAKQAETFVLRGSVLRGIAGFTSSLLGVITNVLLVAVAGIYLAASPRLYRNGVIALLPPAARPRVQRAFDKASRALHLWLRGQLISMALVGVLTTTGLILIGIPSALALGVIAAFAEFVPYVGPIMAAIPALLLALGEGNEAVLYVVLLFVGIQQIESYAITPIVQHRAVDLPPVLTLFALVAFGVLFGPTGIVLGTPLTVALYVLVKQLYVRDLLNEPTHIPGEQGDQPG